MSLSDTQEGSFLPSDDDLVGRQLGDFRLLHRLGRGAMADVYLAEQESLKRRVAVKVLRPELALDPSYLQRFQLEAQAAASLVHANIVQIYEVGQKDSFHYIAQEYVQGQNLRDWLTRHGPLDVPRALSVLRQVGSALTKAAEKGIVHRDIKPENIMITREGEVKVADFGLARTMHLEKDQNLTQVGITMGTPLYMSPEQVEGRPLDPRSDIYSLGVTCFHMLTGSPPFTGETALAVAVQHVKTPPPSLEDSRPDLPAGLYPIVYKMLAKDPAKRYPSARDFLVDLRSVQRSTDEKETETEHLEWEVIDPNSTSPPLNALTLQLDGLMKSMAMQQPPRFVGLKTTLAILATLCLGGAIAWASIPRKSLLGETASKSKPIPPQNSVARQWYWAARWNTPEAWQAVIDYFPEDTFATNRAKQQLAQLYLFKLKNNEKALPLFEELAKEDPYPEFKAFGLAGSACVCWKMKNHEESKKFISNLATMLDKDKTEPLSTLLPKEMLDLLNTTMEEQQARNADTEDTESLNLMLENHTTPAK